MPCQPRKARLLLKEGKATMVRMVPFTLRLLCGSSGYKQEVSLGIDAGAQHIGVSATTEQMVLFEAEAQPRTDIGELLATRRQFRRGRRSRKTRYRKCRFLNRKKRSGWLAPSVQHKVEAHLKTIRLVHEILPVSRTTIEVAQFDLQKIRNPEIEARTTNKVHNSASGMSENMSLRGIAMCVSGVRASRKTPCSMSITSSPARLAGIAPITR